MSILWNKDKLEKVECGTFWLSETPDTPSKGWGAANYRDCTWILFKDKETGKKFYHFNTHLDHAVAAAQTGGAKLIRQRMTSINTAGYPVILTGDMNVEENSSVCALFEMKSARKESGSEDYGVTCHGYGSKTQIIPYVLLDSRLHIRPHQNRFFPRRFCASKSHFVRSDDKKRTIDLCILQSNRDCSTSWDRNTYCQ